MPRRFTARHSLSCVLLTVVLHAAPAGAADWPGFRGPTGMGVTASRGLPLQWGGKDCRNILWKKPLPGVSDGAKLDHNQSSPAIAKGRVFVTVACWPKGSDRSTVPEQHVACYRLTDGERLWDTLVPAGPWKLRDLRGGYAAPTPCTDGERVYVLFGSSILAALDFTGKIVWRHVVPDWTGFDVAIASSPVLHGGRLYLLADRNGGKSTLTAYDPKTGKTIWNHKRKTGFSHTTPVFITHNGVAMMLIGGAKELVALDPKTGDRLWWCQTRGDVTSPVYADGLVYTDSGRGGPGIGIDPGGKGDLTKTHVKWNTRRIPEGLSSPVVAGGCLYRLHNPQVLRCNDWKTGKRLYQQRLQDVSASSSPIATPDGRVYCVSAGKSYVIEAGPKFNLLATNDLGEPHQSSPAVSDRQLIIKGSRHLFCIGEK